MKVITIKYLSYTLNRNFEYNRPAMPALKLKKGSNIQIGKLYSHGCGSPLYRCAIVLIADRGALERIGMGYWCPSCRHAYLDQKPYAIERAKLYGKSYKFKNYTETGNGQVMVFKRLNRVKSKRSKTPPLKEGDRLRITEGSLIYIGDDEMHKIRREHVTIRVSMGLKMTDGKSYKYYNGATYCPSCGKCYLPFRKNQDALRKNHVSYKFIKADLYDEQMKEFRKREREQKEKEKAKKTGEDKCTELERTDNEEKAGKESGFSGSVPYDYSTPEGSRRIGGEDFVVRKGSFACLRNSHKLDEITACITVILPKGRVQDVLVSGWYCRNCGCYCISEGDYEVLKGMGMIIARVYSEKEWITGRKVNPGMLLNDESILHRLGYNVGAADDLSDSARQDMLATMMDFKILSKRQIVDFLDMMVRLRKNIPSMENAVEKWEKDRRFASVYKLNARQYVRVASLSIKDRMRCWDIEDI